VPDRATLTRILFVLQTGSRGSICPGRWVVEWGHLLAPVARVAGAGVWKRLHEVLLLPAADQIDCSCAVVDSRSVPAKRGTAAPARIRRIKANGLEAACYSGRPSGPARQPPNAANGHDSTMFEVLDTIPPLRTGRRGRRRRRPDKAHGDKGYDYRKCRAASRRRGIKHRIARQGVESKERLGLACCSHRRELTLDRLVILSPRGIQLA
jgi:hypothetical protein